MNFLIIGVIVIAVLLILLYVFPIIVVDGNSMLPTYHNGDILIGCRISLPFFKSPLKLREIYVYLPPYAKGKDKHYVIKRLTHINNDGRLFFEGDNPSDSYDSRMYGYVNKDCVIAHCLFTIKRKEQS